MPAGKRQVREGKIMRDKVFDAIDEYVRENGVSPTKRELADILDVSYDTVLHHVAVLIKEDRVIAGPGHRGLRINAFE